VNCESDSSLRWYLGRREEEEDGGGGGWRRRMEDG